jgi:hypothetical protein
VIVIRLRRVIVIRLRRVIVVVVVAMVAVVAVIDRRDLGPNHDHPGEARPRSPF